MKDNAFMNQSFINAVINAVQNNNAAHMAYLLGMVVGAAPTFQEAVPLVKPIFRERYEDAK